MAQTVVPAFYSTRKRFKEPIKNVKDAEKQKVSEILTKDPALKTSSDCKKNVKSKTKGQKVNKVTNYFKTSQESTKKVSKSTAKQEATIKKVSKSKIDDTPNETPRTPKRNLSTPEELTPSKKKPPVSREDSIVISNSPAKPTTQNLSTPTKIDPGIRRKLNLSSPIRYGSPKKFGSPVKKTELSPQKAAMYENLTNHDLASIVNESRSKILFSGRLDELKKSLEKFSSVSAQTKSFQSNSYRITSVIASAKKSDEEPKPFIQGKPAYQKFSYLVASQPESALVLPSKYKFLAEAFRCLDVVVQMINNRKERITYEKVQSGVQKMLNRNFSMKHLGQIMTVLPTAYSLVYEKTDSYTISKSSSPYHLVITPKITNSEGIAAAPSKNQKKNIQHAFVYMTPQHLLERKNLFHLSLLKIVKKHHQDFLARLNFPAVSDENIVRWHPKFPVDSVPDVPVAILPEVPEFKVCTAKDVLNKIKGTVCGRVEKALHSVSEEHKNDLNENSLPEVNSKKNSAKKQNPALKGICTDLLEKIRARESAKLVETMTRSVQDEKRLAMIERIPKIAQILWHYFISERKAAVHIDAAVEKIRHSLNSLSTPEDIKAHLQLIMETMPGWLSLIKISRGEFLTMDKGKDLNVMLDNLK